MKLQFRAAADKDISAMSALVDNAYGKQVRQLYGDSARGRWTHYDESRIRTYIQRQPQGVRVGLWRDEVITVAVCRSYGSLGWFHSLAVHSAHQRQGLGRQAVRDAEAFLHAAGADTIGLMTWPDAVNNIGFYQHLGYRAAGISLFGFRRSHTPLARGNSPLAVHLFSETGTFGRRRTLAQVVQLCDQIMPGLDYTSWLLWSLDQQVGDTLLLWQDDQLLALALAYSISNSHWLEGKLLLISPHANSLDVLWTLEHVRRWAERLGLDSFGFPLDMQHQASVELFRQHSFRLFGDSMLNMVRGPMWPPHGIHHVRFAG